MHAKYACARARARAHTHTHTYLNTHIRILHTLSQPTSRRWPPPAGAIDQAATKQARPVHAQETGRHGAGREKQHGSDHDVRTLWAGSDIARSRGCGPAAVAGRQPSVPGPGPARSGWLLLCSARSAGRRAQAMPREPHSPPPPSPCALCSKQGFPSHKSPLRSAASGPGPGPPRQTLPSARSHRGIGSPSAKPLPLASPGAIQLLSLCGGSLKQRCADCRLPRGGLRQRLQVPSR